MLLVSFWALSNFVTFVSCVSYSHDRESRTHHLHMLKLSHRKDSITIPSIHSYPLLCSILHKVSPKILSNKGMSHVLKKKRAHEGLWKKWTHKGPCKNNEFSHAMPKIIRRERLEHGAPWSLLFTPSTTYPHTCTSRSWLYDLLLFGLDLWLCKIFETSMP